MFHTYSCFMGFCRQFQNRARFITFVNCWNLTQRYNISHFTKKEKEIDMICGQLVLTFSADRFLDITLRAAHYYTLILNLRQKKKENDMKWTWMINRNEPKAK